MGLGKLVFEKLCTACVYRITATVDRASVLQSYLGRFLGPLYTPPVPVDEHIYFMLVSNWDGLDSSLNCIIRKISSRLFECA